MGSGERADLEGRGVVEEVDQAGGEELPEDAHGVLIVDPAPRVGPAEGGHGDGAIRPAHHLGRVQGGAPGGVELRGEVDARHDGAAAEADEDEELEAADVAGLGVRRARARLPRLQDGARQDASHRKAEVGDRGQEESRGAALHA